MADLNESRGFEDEVGIPITLHPLTLHAPLHTQFPLHPAPTHLLSRVETSSEFVLCCFGKIKTAWTFFYMDSTKVSCEVSTRKSWIKIHTLFGCPQKSTHPLILHGLNLPKKYRHIMNFSCWFISIILVIHTSLMIVWISSLEIPLTLMMKMVEVKRKNYLGVTSPWRWITELCPTDDEKLHNVSSLSVNWKGLGEWRFPDRRRSDIMVL